MGRSSKRMSLGPSATLYGIWKNRLACGCSQERHAALHLPRRVNNSWCACVRHHRHTPCIGAGQRAQGSPLRASAPSAAQVCRDDGTRPKIGQFARDYPDVVLDVTTDDSRMDIVAGGFDAGIHFGEYIEKDMIAVRVSQDHRPAIVGSPEYFKTHQPPKVPRDLLQHRCINFCHGSAGLYRWEFERGKKSMSVSVNGPLIVDDVGLVTRAALDGVGLALISDENVAPYFETGALIRVLEDRCQPFPGFFLYYPSRKQQSAALSALIKTLRL